MGPDTNETEEVLVGIPPGTIRLEDLWNNPLGVPWGPHPYGTEKALVVLKRTVTRLRIWVRRALINLRNRRRRIPQLLMKRKR